MSDSDESGDPEVRASPGSDPPSDSDVDSAPTPDVGSDEDEPWRSDLDGRRGVDGDVAETAGGVTVDENGIVRPSLAPEEIDLENALFVVLGAIAMVLVAYQIWSIL